MTRKCADRIGLAMTVMMFVFGTVGSAAGQTTESQPARFSGGALFTTYCSSCHGMSGKGDGPVASSLNPRPADLTRIALRNKGVFPTEKVVATIDGRERVKPHGNSQMPVWGDAFSRTTEDTDPASIKAKIEALAGYLRSIQVPAPENKPGTSN